MNKILRGIHQLLGCNVVKRLQVDKLRTKVMEEKQKDIQKLKKTNGIIRVMIEKGEVEFRVIKK